MSRVSRRHFLAGASLAGLGARAVFGATAHAQYSGGPAFLHGVASGDPLHDRVILWTRITPRSLNDGYYVQYRMSPDPLFRHDVCRGNTWTDASRDFTVKVDPYGLEPNTTYYYQFSIPGAQSPIGRTKTLPAGAVNSLRFAVASCSNYPYGFFHVYRRIAERADLDFVLHLGDYIYEYADGRYGDGASIGRVPQPNREMVTLGDYRLRHATYKTDPDLQEAHRQHPFIVVWDDHESTNDSWRDGAQNHNPELGEGEWEVRKAASIKAYFEWMPIRDSGFRPTQAIYRAFRYGNLAEIDMLDTRLYGREQPASSPADVDTINDPARQLLGIEQETWLFNRLYHSQARDVRWRVLGQQVMMAQLSANGGVSVFNVDQWDGYRAARDRLFQHVTDHNIGNLVVLTGDIHSSWGNDLSFNPYDPSIYDPATGRGSVGVELVTPAVSSPGIEDPVEAAQTAAFLRAVSPHMKLVELNKRGYVLVDIDPERLQSDWYHVPEVRERTDEQSLAGALVCEQGSNFLVPAGSGLSSRSGAPDLAPA